MILENLLGKNTRSRAADTFRRAFLPRFVGGNPSNAWTIVRELEDLDLPIEILRPVYYWVTARSEQLLYDYVHHELYPHSNAPDRNVRVDEVASWIGARLAERGKSWSPTVTTKVACGILATLRDFGILEGAVKKRIAPAYAPVESFSYMAFALHAEGVSGLTLLNHPDWTLFLFSPKIVEHMFLEADRNGLLRYHAAGKIVRIDFPAESFKDMARVIAARTY